jgi:hypothetical protein
LVSVRIPLTSVCVYLWVVGKGVRRARGGWNGTIHLFGVLLLLLPFWLFLILKERGGDLCVAQHQRSRWQWHIGYNLRRVSHLDRSPRLELVSVPMHEGTTRDGGGMLWGYFIYIFPGLLCLKTDE